MLFGASCAPCVHRCAAPLFQHSLATGFTPGFFKALGILFLTWCLSLILKAILGSLGHSKWLYLDYLLCFFLKSSCSPLLLWLGPLSQCHVASCLFQRSFKASSTLFYSLIIKPKYHTKKENIPQLAILNMEPSLVCMFCFCFVIFSSNCRMSCVHKSQIYHSLDFN